MTTNPNQSLKSSLIPEYHNPEYYCNINGKFIPWGHAREIQGLIDAMIRLLTQQEETSQKQGETK